MKKVLVSFSASSVASREFLTGVFDYVNEGHTWNIELGPEPYSLTPRYIASAVRNGIDGIITGINRPTPGYKALIKLDLPIALNNFPAELPPDRPNIAVLRNDELAIGRTAARFLMSKGQFSSYGFVPNTERSYWSVFRERGFRLELSRQGHIPLTFRQKRMELGEWLRLLPKPTAVFAAFDMIAAQVVEACKLMKLRVPEQVAVVGVDNDEVICNAVRPTLSSIQANHVELTRRAAEELDRMMHGKRPSKPNSIFIPPLGIVERDSTRTVPPAGFLINEGLAFIRGNATKGIDVADVARHLGISESLARLRFRTVHGRSIRDEILDARLSAVKRLLRNTPYSLGAIAKDTGFSSACRLSHFFKTETGLSPRAWRSEQAKANLRTRKHS